VLEGPFESLVFSGYHLVKLELKNSNELLGLQIVLLVVVCHIVGLNEEVLLLLEEVLHFDVGDEGGVKVVEDGLSTPHLLLHYPRSHLLHLVKDQEGVSLGEGVKIGDLLKREGELDELLETVFI